jgi:hypothetical protein
MDAFGVAREVALRHGLGDRESDVLLAALCAVETAETSIERVLRTVESIVSTVRQRLAAGHHLNALGEMQNTGPELDRFVRDRERAIDHLKQLAYLLRIDIEEVLP